MYLSKRSKSHGSDECFTAWASVANRAGMKTSRVLTKVPDSWQFGGLWYFYFEFYGSGPRGANRASHRRRPFWRWQRLRERYVHNASGKWNRRAIGKARRLGRMRV